ncbi:hypothetical protein AN480_28475 (plasmid) [Mycobacterium intracellulare subsp. chimaera]|uniref:hypothetical protein n=1 Tax=Mycobacterium intracellulare TaxID=1767 RepID=UPI0008596CD2|nr:hypothetical protein [Mycobacterium intracellulare]AOS94978.1 hypothetical protein AN480_28475 [Mycobacterium intracellulare subsp. chimaera]
MAKTSKSLIDLIEIAARRHGEASGRRLAELAQRAGHDISHATLNRLRQGTYATRPSDASIRAIAYLADVSENVAFAAAAVAAPAAVVYQPPAEAQRMTTRQCKAVDELIRAFAADDKPAPAAGLDFGRLLAARERLNTALTAGGEHITAEQLVEAAREAVAGIDEVIDALFAAASDQDPTDDESLSDCTGFTTDNPARAVG